jgi:hypothetical protein
MPRVLGWSAAMFGSGKPGNSFLVGEAPACLGNVLKSERLRRAIPGLPLVFPQNLVKGCVHGVLVARHQGVKRNPFRRTLHGRFNQAWRATVSQSGLLLLV